MTIPDSVLQAIGPVSIFFIWMGLLFVIYRWPGNKSMSFSQHAASTKNGQIFYFALFTITLPLFYIFMVQWFVPTFQLPAAFTYIVTLGVLCQFVAVIVPAIPGTKERVHNIAAYTMACTMIPLVLLIAFAQISLFARIAAIIAATYMIGIIFLPYFFKHAHSYYLFFQATYIALFHLVILLCLWLS